MCLTMPGKVVALDGTSATVDYGAYGKRENVNVSLVNARLGNFVLVQGGFAIKLLSEKEARESLKMWEVVLEELEPGGLP